MMKKKSVSYFHKASSIEKFWLDNIIDQINFVVLNHEKKKPSR